MLRRLPQRSQRTSGLILKQVAADLQPSFNWSSLDDQTLKAKTFSSIQVWISKEGKSEAAAHDSASTVCLEGLPGESLLCKINMKARVRLANLHLNKAQGFQDNVPLMPSPHVSSETPHSCQAQQWRWDDLELFCYRTWAPWNLAVTEWTAKSTVRGRVSKA